ncbi:S-layer homology domain-containing protein [Paenibacillus sp. DYY-L-2]|uniref:RCC1 domain-containing protein n=1 Tax=Paenibacillus sp. DYY-L-2 TaxID=3447013 RepID=UPI003F501C0A
MVLKKDGTVWTWGDNILGQLGNGTTEESSVPVQVANLNNVIAISAGVYHNMALKSDGTVWVWGAYSVIPSGNGAFYDGIISKPIQVPGVTNIKAISAGGWHSMALSNDGTVWVWGTNSRGEYGNGTFISDVKPVKMQGLTDVTAIVAGGQISIALKSDGTVWGAGHNTWGELGTGAKNAMNLTPVQVQGLSKVKEIAYNAGTMLALKNDGTVWGLGNNDSGQLGNGTKEDSVSSPVQVQGLSQIKHISVGGNHGLALKDNGTVWAWGSNFSGQLGDGTFNNSVTPVQVSGLTNVEKIAALGLTSFALKSDGTAWIWGDRTSELGDNSGGRSPIKMDMSKIGKPNGQPNGPDTPGNSNNNTQRLTISQHKQAEVKPPQNSDDLINQEQANPSDINLTNFTEKNIYKGNQFADIRGTEWYANDVRISFELGLMSGKSSTVFDPSGKILVSEAIAIASRVHNIYHGGNGEINNNGSNWYDGVVSYAIQNKIVNEKSFTNYNNPATREQLAYIFSNALPDSVFSKINNITAIPDVKLNSKYGSDIYKLYSAGVLTGSDEKGSFKPTSNITRAEAAAIINRVVKPDNRVRLGFLGLGGSDSNNQPTANTNGTILLNISTDVNTDLSMKWTRFMMSLTDSKGQELTVQVSMDKNDSSYGFEPVIYGVADGKYKVSLVSSDYANVEFKSNTVQVVNGHASLDVVVKPRYVLEVGKNGTPYKFSVINVNKVASKVYSGAKSESFGVSPDESYMIQDKDTDEVFTVYING